MIIKYYAIFDYSEYDDQEEKYGISITFPDIPEANTDARSYEEGVDMATDVLQLCLIDDNGNWIPASNLPPASSLDSIIVNENQKAVLISFDTDKVDMKKFKIML